MPRPISELSAEEAEAVAEAAARQLGYELVKVGNRWTFRHRSWNAGVLHAIRRPTKLQVLDAIIQRFGTKEQK